MSRASLRVRRAFRVLSLGLGGLCLFYALFGGEYPVHALVRMEMEQKSRVGEITILRQQVDSLRHARNRLASDPALVERIAREQFGLTRSDEVIYRFVPAPGLPEKSQK